MDSDDALLGMRLGNFVITGTIGRGGMGVVFEARHTTLPTRAAVKVLLDEYGRDPDLVRRFLDEAHAAATINDVHVVRVFDAGTLPDGRPYLVMEYLEGTNLAKVVEAGQLPIPRATSILKQVARAIATIHGHGILHRDLKPDNVHLGRDAKGNDLVKVLDFGLAKTEGLARGVTTAGAVVGTPDWMSPEQAQGKALDRRADIYSFGCVAFATLTCAPPFDAGSAVGLLVAHVSQPVPDVRTKRFDCPAELAALIAQCMAKSPDQRPATMERVLASLEAMDGSNEKRIVIQSSPGVRRAGLDATMPVPELESTIPGPTPMRGPVESLLPRPSVVTGGSTTALTSAAASGTVPTMVSQAPRRSGASVLLVVVGATIVVGAAAVAGYLYVSKKAPADAPVVAESTSKGPKPKGSGSATTSPPGGGDDAKYGDDKNPFKVTDLPIVAAGGAVWRSKCEECHGAHGDGAGTNLKNGMRPRAFSDVTLPAGTLDVYYYQIIRQGIERASGNSMPSFKGKMSKKETWQVVTFMNTLHPKPKQVDVEKEIAVGAPPFTDELKARGRDLYFTRCSGCHGDDLKGDGPASTIIPQPPTDLADGAWNADTKKIGETDFNHIFRIVTTGYGDYMGAFSNLSTNDRWTIARYVNAVRAQQEKP